jgi:hypothetical protein
LSQRRTLFLTVQSQREVWPRTIPNDSRLIHKGRPDYVNEMDQSNSNHLKVSIDCTLLMYQYAGRNCFSNRNKGVVKEVSRSNNSRMPRTRRQTNIWLFQRFLYTCRALMRSERWFEFSRSFWSDVLAASSYLFYKRNSPDSRSCRDTVLYRTSYQLWSVTGIQVWEIKYQVANQACHAG